MTKTVNSFECVQNYKLKFHFDLANNVTRGCIIELSEDEYQKCLLDVNCSICKENYCNQEVFSSSVNITANNMLVFSIVLLLFRTPLYVSRKY